MGSPATVTGGLAGHRDRTGRSSAVTLACRRVDALTGACIQRDGFGGVPAVLGDGCDDNRSWNCGVEGQTDDPAVEKLRNRQVRNFLTVTMLSMGSR